MGEGKTSAVEKVGSGGRTRTCDSMINSHLQLPTVLLQKRKKPVDQATHGRFAIFDERDGYFLWARQSCLLAAYVDSVNTEALSNFQ